jgi:hypothetical protein
MGDNIGFRAFGSRPSARGCQGKWRVPGRVARLTDRSHGHTEQKKDDRDMLLMIEKHDANPATSFVIQYPR